MTGGASVGQPPTVRRQALASRGADPVRNACGTLVWVAFNHYLGSDSSQLSPCRSAERKAASASLWSSKAIDLPEYERMGYATAQCS